MILNRFKQKTFYLQAWKSTAAARDIFEIGANASVLGSSNEKPLISDSVEYNRKDRMPWHFSKVLKVKPAVHLQILDVSPVGRHICSQPPLDL